jgi:chromosome segregation ATPase
MDSKRIVNLLTEVKETTAIFASLDDEITQRTRRVEALAELTLELQDWLSYIQEQTYPERLALEKAQQQKGKRPASHAVNTLTGEITFVDLTPDEIAQRDAERAASEAEAALPKPKSELEQLRELTETLTKRVSDLEKGKPS